MPDPEIRSPLPIARSLDAGSARSERRLLRVQAISGSIFLLFTLVHLANTGIAALGVEAYSDYQHAARRFYQHPLGELGLMAAPLVVHAGAAIARLRRSGLRGRNRRLRSRLHRLSGYFLLVVIGGHVAATRGPSLLAGVDVGFGAISYTFLWMPYWFYPYYTALALAGLYHGLNGALVAASVFGLRVPQALRGGPAFWLAWAGAAGAVVIGLLAFGGALYAVPDPRANDYARFMIELTGGR